MMLLFHADIAHKACRKPAAAPAIKNIGAAMTPLSTREITCASSPAQLRRARYASSIDFDAIRYTSLPPLLA